MFAIAIGALFVCIEVLAVYVHIMEKGNAIVSLLLKVLPVLIAMLAYSNFGTY